MKKTTDVSESIKNQITTGEVNPGDRLPSIKKLAILYDVSTITIRNALEQLTQEGFIETRERSGCFVKAPDEKLLHLTISNEYNIQDEIIDIRALLHEQISNVTVQPTVRRRPLLIDQAVRINWLYTTFFNAPVAYEECVLPGNSPEQLDLLRSFSSRAELEGYLGEKGKTFIEVRLVVAEKPIQQQLRLNNNTHVFLFEKAIYTPENELLAACKTYVLPDSVLFHASN